MHSVDTATRMIHSHCPDPGTERVHWSHAAGRILAEPVIADRDFPPFDRVAMDGVALQYQAWLDGLRQFPLEGSQAAGQPRGRLHSPEHCIEAMTGAPLPEGCDCIVPVELLERQGNTFTVPDTPAPVPGRHIHHKGSDRRAGDVLLEPGTRLRSPEIAVLATVGRDHVSVVCLPHILVLATGDELVPVESTPLPHQIRLSNGHALVTALNRAGFPAPPCRWLPDNEAVLSASIAEALSHANVLVLSGGVSMGRFDLVPSVLAGLGVEEVFHRVAQRPGKPFWYGRGPEGQSVFALPGNPVSTAVCLARYVLPWLERCVTGQEFVPDRVRLAGDVNPVQDLTQFLPVRIETSISGERLAWPVPTAGSGDFARLCQSSGFVELPPGTGTLPAGTVLPCWIWH